MKFRLSHILPTLGLLVVIALGVFIVWAVTLPQENLPYLHDVACDTNPDSPRPLGPSSFISEMSVEQMESLNSSGVVWMLVRGRGKYYLAYCKKLSEKSVYKTYFLLGNTPVLYKHQNVVCPGSDGLAHLGSRGQLIIAQDDVPGPKSETVTAITIVNRESCLKGNTL